MCDVSIEGGREGGKGVMVRLVPCGVRERRQAVIKGGEREKRERDRDITNKDGGTESQ
jgi:hypothetical protein